ncbi:hypothetical protein FHS82_000901 [Pseudochelatococcus lubricantis]|uniref:Uncharacterized protein n=1 Tax=Pseudochelatococcus lubricantis TaxID=1538102 RepID=A0ABX0UYW2_9HYPH|nr:DUF6384 family protein [Pseudochelatococcus lubricantis]NIJ57075.1 hypothetical protein [Pseudochelatococcus lubricantis]
MSSKADTPASGSAGALDEVMLAMDVVDTLRHNENVALKELGQEGRDEDLKERLRRIYESQGLEVSDRILDEGIKALKESRFTYEPAEAGSRLLAGIWVRRGLYGKIAGAVLVALVTWIGVSAWRGASEQRAREAARIELAETLPRRLEQAASRALADARTADARDRAEALHADGVAALTQGDADAARGAAAALEQLRARLAETYRLRIVSRPGEDTGVFRIPDVNSNARNYYLIVEAVTPDGKVLSLPVRSEEDGKVKTVTRWGVRVPQRTFDAVRRDKGDDGIVQNDTLAEKPRGGLEPVYRMNVSPDGENPGTITEW